MSSGTRRQYSAAFKLNVVEFAEANGNMAAQRRFGVSEKSVRYWRAQKGKLQMCNPRKMSFRGRSAVHPQLEDKLADFVREVRARSLPVTVDTIRKNSREKLGSREKSFVHQTLGCVDSCDAKDFLSGGAHPSVKSCRRSSRTSLSTFSAS